MSRNVSSAFKQAAFSQETNTAFIMLVTISHDSFSDDIRLASDSYEDLPTAGVRGVISRSEEYIYLPLAIVLSQEDDSGVARASISVDNINRDIIAAVRSATSAVSVTIEVVLSSDPDTVEVSVQDFRLERVEYDAFTVSGDLSVEYFDLEPFPSGRFTPSKFPGMF